MIPINHINERAIILQQIALNHKMLENGHITKRTHSKTHNILLNNLTNIAPQDMVSESELINHSGIIQFRVAPLVYESNQGLDTERPAQTSGVI